MNQCRADQQTDPSVWTATHSFNNIDGEAEQHLRAALSHIEGLDLDLSEIKD